ncbi:uncharacterized protein BYT42DRAFT_608998 [Radiomyces spectabilis]|uniref:uncharacterized protein n=1 Tax=Radiomyces spectabilis TaxID=64574 RepID=UPI0022209C20|nr:uncharacterized protein BYT42DRAFT_608998 [Radiomyces spectabilis]KAI8364789.1 hypothetical protein BYT42DRAFT_608998 [Radiomyces spectabilis]
MWYAKTYSPVQVGSIDGTDTVPHDHAVERALTAHYTAPKHLTTDPRKTLFVARLNLSTTEESLQKLFGRFGELDQVILIRNQVIVVTGTSQGYGFVTFRRSAAASEAYKRAHHAVLDEHVILVDYERSRIMKGWVPRRLGGGFGGQKESGQLRFGARERGFREPIYCAVDKAAML